MQAFMNTLLHIIVALVVVLNFVILAFWLSYSSPQQTMRNFYELNGGGASGVPI